MEGTPSLSPARPTAVYRPAPFGTGGEPAWTAAAQWLAAWITDEDESARLRLADTRVAVHAAVQAFAEAGLSVDLVSDSPPAGTRLRYESEPPIEISVQLLSENPLASRESLVGAVEDWYQVAHTATGRAMAVILAAQRSMTRLDALVPGCRDASTPGASTRVPPSVLQNVSSPDEDPLPSELTVTTMGVAFASNGYVVLIYDLHKDGTTT